MDKVDNFLISMDQIERNELALDTMDYMTITMKQNFFWNLQKMKSDLSNSFLESIGL